MKTRIAIAILLFLAALSPARVDASNVSCPSNVSGVVSFHEDLIDCAGGLTLVGDTTIKLNGFTLDGTVVGTAIVNTGPHSLKILGPGTIKQFEQAIYSLGPTQMRKVSITEIDAFAYVVHIVTDKAKIKDNNISMNSASALLVEGDKVKVINNTFDTNLANGVGVIGDDAKVKGNTATNNDLQGITVVGNGTRIVDNSSTLNGRYGIRVDGDDIQVKKNHANGNGLGMASDGIFGDVTATDLELRGNETSNNTDFGFNVPSDTVAINNFGSGNTSGLCNLPAVCP